MRLSSNSWFSHDVKKIKTKIKKMLSFRLHQVKVIFKYILCDCSPEIIL